RRGRLTRRPPARRGPDFVRAVARREAASAGDHERDTCCAGRAGREVSASSMPRLTAARAPLIRSVEAVNEYGTSETVSIPAERPLTLYVDRRELVTLMTLGAMPEL